MSWSLDPTKAAIILQQAAEDLQQVKGMKLPSDQVRPVSEQDAGRSDWNVSKHDTLDAVILLIIIGMAGLIVGSVLMLGSFKGLFWGMNS